MEWKAEIFGFAFEDTKETFIKQDHINNATMQFEYFIEFKLKGEQIKVRNYF
jgi:hypothetical protein